MKKRILSLVLILCLITTLFPMAAFAVGAEAANTTATAHIHSYEAIVTAPTCTENGYTTHICSCGDSYKDTYVRALGHTYVNGVCTECGAADSAYVPTANVGNIVLSNEKAKKGEEAVVKVSIENNPGIMVMVLSFDYDASKLELLGIEDGLMTGWIMNEKAVWIGGEDMTEDGVILNLKFKVLEDVEDGEIIVSVSYAEGDIANHNEEIIMPSKTDGSVTVYTIDPGDITGDGKINALDLIRLQRYISGEDVAVAGNCDITGDGKINALDLIRLQRYISGEDVEIH